MIIASDVSEDGKKILVTMSPDGQSDIYLYDLEKKVKTKITKYKGIDVNKPRTEPITPAFAISFNLRVPCKMALCPLLIAFRTKVIDSHINAHL